jgi:hypothetical protein
LTSFEIRKIIYILSKRDFFEERTLVANEITRFEPLRFYFAPQISFGTGKTISKTRKDFSLVIISVLSNRSFFEEGKMRWPARSSDLALSHFID